MEELKACLFCGRYVDRTYRYCPHCGYEFTQEDEALDGAEELGGADPGPDGPEEQPRPAAKRMEAHYLLRLRDIQKLLTDMERELDLIISRTDPSRGPAERPPEGALTTSSRDP
jgi:hypothetical protein